MSEMQRAADLVRDTIEGDPVVRNGLSRGLINMRALARQIQVSTRQGPSIEALVAAIRRYPVKESITKDKRVSRQITKLSMKNEVVDVEIQNAPEIPGLLAKFSEKVDTTKGESLSMAASVQEWVVVIDSKNLDKLMGMIPKRNILSVTRDLTEVSLTMSDDFNTTVGAMASITSEIAMEGINVVEYVRAAPYLGILVEEEDALRAYRAMERLRNRDRR